MTLRPAARCRQGRKLPEPAGQQHAVVRADPDGIWHWPDRRRASRPVNLMLVAAVGGLLVVDDIACCGEAGDDPKDAALGDAQRRADVTRAHPRVLGDADEGLGPGRKVPLRCEKIVLLFQKSIASFLEPA